MAFDPLLGQVNIPDPLIQGSQLLTWYTLEGHLLIDVHARHPLQWHHHHLNQAHYWYHLIHSQAVTYSFHPDYSIGLLQYRMSSLIQICTLAMMCRSVNRDDRQQK